MKNMKIILRNNSSAFLRDFQRLRVKTIAEMKLVAEISFNAEIFG